MADLEKAKRWLQDRDGPYGYEDPQGVIVEKAEEIIEELVAEVEQLRRDRASLDEQITRGRDPHRYDADPTEV